MTSPSATHLILIPSYNPGSKVVETVHAARAHWNPVWVVTDGSTDGTPDLLQTLAVEDSGLNVIKLPANAGKGAAVLHGLDRAAAAGFTHALIMDFGRSASGRINRRLHVGIDAPSQQHDSRYAGVRRQRAQSAC